MDGWGEAAVDAEDLVVDHHAQGEEVEHVGEVVPDVGVAVFPDALGVEAIGLCDASGFVVPANQMHTLGVSQFQADKERYRFHAEQAAIHVVTCWPNRRLSAFKHLTSQKQLPLPPNLGINNWYLDRNHQS